MKIPERIPQAGDTYLYATDVSQGRATFVFTLIAYSYEHSTWKTIWRSEIEDDYWISSEHITNLVAAGAVTLLAGF